MEPADRETATGLPPGIAAAREELTPMLSQYADLCAAHEDALVLFQVGDFYEAFCEAAETVARVCEVTLTERSDSTGDYPMAGIPIDNAAPYLESLLDAGYRVALGDQVEDAEQASGLVDRAVTEVITPGTVVEDDLLESGTTNYVAAVAAEGDGGESDTPGASDRRVGLAAVDVSTGECLVTAGDRDAVAGELDRIAPAELIAGPDAPAFEPSDAERGWTTHDYDADAFDRRTATERLKPYLPAPERRFDADAELRAAGAVIAYAEYTQGDDGPLSYVTRIRRYDPRDRLRLDAAAQRSLELFENRGLGASDTLFDALDETNCALGRRCLERWLRRPLVDADAIRSRHDAVGELADRSLAREGVADALSTAYDLERLVSRVSRGRADARDLRSLHRTLAVVPELKATLAGAGGEAGASSEPGGADEGPALPRTDHLRDLRDRLDELTEVRELIDGAVAVDPPQEITEGGVIREGFDGDLDDLRATEREGREWVAALEASERERTGIDSLSVGHNQVHGYYIEVTDANVEKVPDDYRRRQTLKNSERYVTPELKEREEEIVGAAERADALEYDLFVDVRERVAAETERIQGLADALAELDALTSLAAVAVARDYVRPELREGPDADVGGAVDPAGGVEIEGGRHPVVERAEESFVPNDADLPRGSVAVITGPNMSGKSTYMRSVALAVVLAQTGSFVPAQAATLPVFDRLFTRVGASDDIAGGQSTFMREMSELTEILHDAGADSLVLLDEVGRGTATTDGRAIARAAAEFLHDELGATALFATHYHGLTDLADERERVFNLHFTATREDGDVTFLHRVVPGASSSSYGVEVAELAGVPGPVVDRARDLVAAEEADRRGNAGGAGSEGGTDDGATGGADPDDADRDGDASLREFLAEEASGERDEGGPEAGDPSIETPTGSDPEPPANETGEAGAAAGAPSDLTADLRDLDLARMTPIEALNALHDLQSRVDDDG
ncbi:DNA mismatch repair protein MutS [Halorubrum sp. 2020YC2]|uniref:DNA mismatch repair protein MutS n=1 Tax=Halorubrum sp. 2020YC2 TaxID=2836432 RepID=UPI001BE66187|nr:DNA mismatch repair protein MutS [Halorubrum sp. 2020YC2]QWC18527.1 DNA mismatch repair protein MutS [Halorubrum sp. 2020YC2]